MRKCILKVAAIVIAALFAVSLPSQAQSRKGVSILGDSYSTFENMVEPAGNALWYFKKPDPKLTDVNDVKQTWWHIFISENGYRLVQNNSFSGSTICNTGYDGADYSDRSFITRMDNIGSPDILFIFGATNDSWANAPIGEFVWSDWTPEQLKSFRPALAYMLSHVKDRYPNTDIVYLINDGLKPEITSSIIEACNRYSIPYIELKEIDKTAGHPNRHGMRQIADQIKANPYFRH
ncbi:hypothetical protein EEL33_07770 [Muribaculaceae bacterium Isolate-037 (Harlan)]|nr:hypothetical protein EEL33_07770 [Muribaculaceae bacterium Isolate-037 (Harlan)]